MNSAFMLRWLSREQQRRRPFLAARCWAFFVLVVLIGCGDNRGGLADAPISIVSTTGQIYSALENITAGTETQLELLCGPGVDPHSYSASTKDVQLMLDCDLIVYNGFHLEARLSEHLKEKFGEKSWAMASAFPRDARLDWLEDGQIDQAAPFDPHIWNHLPGWMQCVRGLSQRLIELDPKNESVYTSNTESYLAEIQQAHQWAGEKLSQLPAQSRVIVSSHDAFNYFAKLYHLETLAVLGIGNDAEADMQTMRSVAQQIVDRKIPAIFIESISNPQVVTALKEACQSRQWQVEIVDQPIYSDDLGLNPPQNTFLGAFRSNVTVIYNALQTSENQPIEVDGNGA